MTDIKPDTSLYPNDLPSRFRALALIAEGYARDKLVEYIRKDFEGDSWSDVPGAPTWASHFDYRLKPGPRVVWVNFYENIWDYIASDVYQDEQAARNAAPGAGKRIATAVRVELPE